nr:hypothetical protein Iba_chr01fCG4250 [Ipomoea batatas]
MRIGTGPGINREEPPGSHARPPEGRPVRGFKGRAGDERPPDRYVSKWAAWIARLCRFFHGAILLGERKRFEGATEEAAMWSGDVRVDPAGRTNSSPRKTNDLAGENFQRFFSFSLSRIRRRSDHSNGCFPFGRPNSGKDLSGFRLSRSGCLFVVVVCWAVMAVWKVLVLFMGWVKLFHGVSRRKRGDTGRWGEEVEREEMAGGRRFSSAGDKCLRRMKGGAGFGGFAARRGLRRVLCDDARVGRDMVKRGLKK